MLGARKRSVSIIKIISKVQILQLIKNTVNFLFSGHCKKRASLKRGNPQKADTP